jgi:hypothetical protein
VRPSEPKSRCSAPLSRPIHCSPPRLAGRVIPCASWFRVWWPKARWAAPAVLEGLRPDGILAQGKPMAKTLGTLCLVGVAALSRVTVPVGLGGGTWARSLADDNVP